MTKLEKLFGSKAQVRIMRLFLFNPSNTFEKEEVTKRTKVRTASATKVLSLLEKVGLIKKKTASKKVTVKSRSNKKKKGKKKTKTKKVKVWTLNTSFSHLTPLRNLLTPTDALSNKEIEKKFKSGGKVKLLTVAGVFLHEPDSRIDLLVVGDKLKSRNLSKAVADLEALIGTSLTYATMETNDFLYRHNINDRLIRDIFDYRHEKIINKLNL